MRITFKSNTSPMKIYYDDSDYVTICEDETHSCVHLTRAMFGRLCIAIRAEVF